MTWPKTPVTALTPDHVALLRPLLMQSAFKPYRALRLSGGTDVVGLWLTELAASSNHPAGAAFAAWNGERVAGLAAVADQEWESRVLGRKAAVITQFVNLALHGEGASALSRLLGEALAWSQARGVELLVCKVHTDNMAAIHALEQSSFQLVDTALHFVYDAGKAPLANVLPPTLARGCRIRPANANDRAALVEVADRAFRGHFGRFHADARIPHATATRVYREWIESSLNGYADFVLVAEADGVIVGYSIWKKPSAWERQFDIPLGHYSIGAVHPDHSGRGVFGALTYGGMTTMAGILSPRNANDFYIEGPTHINNYPVQCGYTKLHWRIGDARHTFHRWLEH